MIEGLKVRIKATAISAMPLHRMRVADMTILVKELATSDCMQGLWVTTINVLQTVNASGRYSQRKVRLE